MMAVKPTTITNHHNVNITKNLKQRRKRRSYPLLLLCTLLVLVGLFLNLREESKFVGNFLVLDPSESLSASSDYSTHHYPHHQHPPPPHTYSNTRNSVIDTTSIQTCAPHLTEPEQRRVLFVGLSNWDGFYNGTYTIRSQSSQSYWNTPPQAAKEHFTHRGEDYVFAALDWSLQQNEFVVEATKDDLEDFTPQELMQYHRIFKNQDDFPESLRDYPEILCKIRFLHFWGNWKPTTSNNEVAVPSWDPRQALAPYPESYNTFLGYFVHSLVQTQTQKTQSTPSASRLKEGFLLGKKPHIFEEEQNLRVIQALIDDGFVLHSTCSNYDICNTAGGPWISTVANTLGITNKDCKPNCGLPPQVIVHGKMPPNVYASLMSEMAFVIGFGDPIVSPSPLEALAHGAAFLNPLGGTVQEKQQWMIQQQQQQQQEPLSHYYHSNSKPIKESQHRPISLLGMPYVYNIDLENTTTVLEAANYAVQYRFSSYTPPDYMPQSMIARSCGIMADDAICQCPRTTNKNYNNNNKRGGDPSSMNPDCRGNSYIRIEDNR